MIPDLASPRLLRAILPALSLTVILVAIFYLQPRAMSYMGLNLLLNLAVPIALATIAQMFVICVNDLDLSIGAYVGFCACVTATWLNDAPLIGAAALAACILAYALLGALIHLRNLPSIVVTLGMSFVWLGLSVMLLPTPGGKAPEWIRAVMTLKTPVVPFSILAVVAIGAAVHLLLMRSAYGAVLRGAGGNARSVARAGWSMLKIKMVMYAFAGLFGMLAGMALVGLTTSADANIALRYTLLSIAGVILGGGEFVGGRISPIGAVIGAVTLTLAGSFLSFMRISPDWQIGAQGAILIIVLALRALINRAEARP
ncbi:ribose transport system permease protein [Tepidamorphus gemmatus]|uniref:Ribose transport system permease protein n=1 Tax=Tepidamorphus gemmatus TaxID=747076 RepID=A0A4R3ME40_9HYPH|nr:ABC transporter permease [Tepidamorphus gemmatus]TCT10569.1 ribose transport system permease protein [Tepidamorphus gemmatus]